MDISIIVPVYNVELYLERCLNSIFGQQFNGSFEVIAVEDGSSDNSLLKLYEYQKRENRLKIIVHSENKKLSIARATGMKEAQGDYIMHVDSDDWLIQGALENLYSKLIKTDADVIVFNYITENSQNKRTYIRNIKRELMAQDKSKVQSHFYGGCWNKIVKRKLTLNMLSGQVSVNNSEDLLYATEILFRAEKIYLIPEYYYVYFANIESLTHTYKSEEFLKNQLIILKQLQEIISKYNANSKLIRNILNYFEKWIYLEFAKTHFWYNGKFLNSKMIVRKMANYSIMSEHKIRRLELSIKSGTICFFEIAYRFRLNMINGIIKGSFKNRPLIT